MKLVVAKDGNLVAEELKGVRIYCRTCGPLYAGWVYPSNECILGRLAVDCIRRGHGVTGTHWP